MEKIVIEGQELHTLQPNTIAGDKACKKGINGVKGTGVALPDELLSKHILAMGSIGSGKTNAIYHVCHRILNHMTPDDVIIFFDPKGDYTEKFFNSNCSYITGNLNPNQNNVHWNMFSDFSFVDESLMMDEIREICATLFQNYIEKASNPSFIMGARDLFMALTIICYRNARDKHVLCTNAHLERYISSLTVESMKQDILQHSDLTWTSFYIMKENSVTTQGYLTNLQMIVHELLTGCFKREGDFSIKQFVANKGGKRLFLNYDVANSAASKPVYTVLLDMALKQALSSQKQMRGNVYFVLDEFALIPKLNYMDSALNFGRSMGVKVIGSIQNVSQVNTTYGESLSRSIISGFSTLMIFRLFDMESRDILINRYGRNKVKYSYNQTIAINGISDSFVEGNVIEDWDISTLQIGQCIVALPNGDPFIFHPLKYE